MNPVLFVEEDEAIRSLLAFQLTTKGKLSFIAPTILRNPEQALEVLAKNSFDAIVSGVRFDNDEYAGKHFYDQIRRRGYETPFGHITGDDPQDFTRHAPVPILQRPYKPKEFKEFVYELINSKS